MNSHVIARPLAGVLAAAVALLVPLAAAPSAHADGEGGGDIFRYWAYFHVEDGEYVAAQEGLGAFTPRDGSTEALRFAAPADFDNPNLPRADLDEVDFETVCSDAVVADGEKRVALILDFGVEADAGSGEPREPAAACATVPQEANALQTIQDVADVRTESSSFGPQLCAVSGYPATGCSESVRNATPPDDGTVEFDVAGQETGGSSEADAAADESGDDGGNVALYVLIGVVAIALVVGGLVLARRRT